MRRADVISFACGLILIFVHRVDSQALEEATSAMINSLSQQKLSTVDVWQSSKIFILYSFLNKVWKEPNLSVTLTTKTMKSENRKPIKTNFGVFLFENDEQFLEAFNPKLYDIRGLYLVVLTLREFNMSSVFNMMWNFSFCNVDILSLSEDGSVDLSTFYPFNRYGCHDVRPVSINKFDNNTWKSQKFFPKKLKDFHFCALKISTHTVSGQIEEVKFKNGSINYQGNDMRLLKEISLALNFEAKIKHSTVKNDWGDLFENGTVSGVIGRLLHGHADFIMGFFVNRIRLMFLDFSETYSIHSIVVVVPLGEPFTSIEDLYRPFSLIVWIAFSLVVVAACVFILTLRLFKIKMRFPLHNLLMIEVGVPVARLPTDNFSRILIMSFLIFCLVLRTIYQSKMFNFLQSQDRKNAVTTLAEMEEQQFDLYLLSGLSRLLEDIVKYPAK